MKNFIFFIFLFSFLNPAHSGNVPDSFFEEFSLKKEKIFFIEKKEDLNKKSLYQGHQLFESEIMSQLYSNQDFIIYANKNLLNSNCYSFFALYSIKKCNSSIEDYFSENFEKVYGDLFSKEKLNNGFGLFLKYHELAHFLIKNKNLSYAEQEIRSDLLALNLLWYYHEIDFRKEAWLMRKLNYMIKKDENRWYYNYLKNWDFKEKTGDNLITFLESWIKKNDHKEESEKVELINRLDNAFSKHLSKNLFKNNGFREEFMKEIREYDNQRELSRRI